MACSAIAFFLDHGYQDTIPVDDLEEILNSWSYLPKQSKLPYLGSKIMNIIKICVKSMVAKVDKRSKLALAYKASIKPQMVLLAMILM